MCQIIKKIGWITVAGGCMNGYLVRLTFPIRGVQRVDESGFTAIALQPFPARYGDSTQICRTSPEVVRSSIRDVVTRIASSFPCKGHPLLGSE